MNKIKQYIEEKEKFLFGDDQVVILPRGCFLRQTLLEIAKHEVGRLQQQGKKIDDKRSADERRYPIGYNTAIREQLDYWQGIVKELEE